MPDGDDGYRLETGINLREYDMCDEKFKTKLATSVSGYKKVSLVSNLRCRRLATHAMRRDAPWTTARREKT